MAFFNKAFAVRAVTSRVVSITRLNGPLALRRKQTERALLLTRQSRLSTPWPSASTLRSLHTNNVPRLELATKPANPRQSSYLATERTSDYLDLSSASRTDPSRSEFGMEALFFDSLRRQRAVEAQRKEAESVSSAGFRQSPVLMASAGAHHNTLHTPSRSPGCKASPPPAASEAGASNNSHWRWEASLRILNLLFIMCCFESGRLLLEASSDEAAALEGEHAKTRQGYKARAVERSAVGAGKTSPQSDSDARTKSRTDSVQVDGQGCEDVMMFLEFSPGR